MEIKPGIKAETKFISTISHKLRTPLNSILGFSELLLDQVYGPLNEKQTHYLKNVQRSGTNLLTLLNDLIDFMNLKWGEATVDYTGFSLPQALDEAQMEMKTIADRKGVLLEIRHDNYPSTIEADETKFSRILHHLISNAIKFTPAEGKVTVSASVSQGYLEISVADTGIGIKPENQEKIFSGFYQVDPDLSQEFEGTGLGLAIARELVRLHGGKMWVESENGKGSIFTFILPVAKQ